MLADSKNVLGCNDVGRAEGATTTAAFLTQNMDSNRFPDPGLRDPHNRIRTTVETEAGVTEVVVSLPDIRPQLGSVAADVNFVKTPPDTVTLSDGRQIQGFFDTTVDFVGGVDPFNNWTMDDWTYYGPF